MRRPVAILLTIIGAFTTGYAQGLPGEQMWLAGVGGFLVGFFGIETAKRDRQ